MPHGRWTAGQAKVASHCCSSRITGLYQQAAIILPKVRQQVPAERGQSTVTAGEEAAHHFQQGVDDLQTFLLAHLPMALLLDSRHSLGLAFRAQRGLHKGLLLTNF